MPVRRLMLGLSLACLINPLRSEVKDVPAWYERFRSERRSMMGSPSRHSADDVRRFYLLPSPSVPTAAADPIPVSPIVSESVPEEAAPLSLDVKKPVRRKRRVRPLDSAQGSRLLTKSRHAYDAGRLEEAREYYQRVERLQPDFAEAKERLMEIEKQLQ